ncbi:MAG TPA: tetratricopeptide repeat protein [Verrucomicrobiae bacterium]|nr:tetratricopeptide repeat protein [Verrucomicrobiae bacterium]
MKSAARSASPDHPEKVAQAHAHYAAAIVHDMNDETEAALQDYYQAAADDPADEGLVLEVSRRLIQNKQFDKALELLTRAAAEPGASGAVYARLGVVYGQLGRIEQAIAAGKMAIRLSPDELGGYQNLFVNYLQSKQEQPALKVLDEAARRPNVDAEFLVGLAELYLSYATQAPSQKEQVNAKATATLNRAEKINPTNPSLRLKLAEAYNSAGNSEKAAQLYLELLKKLPDLPMLHERIHAKLAGIYLRTSDHKKALEQLEAIVRDDPTNAEAYYYLGYISYTEKRFPEAADYFSKTILLNPEFPDPYYELALSQLNLNKPDDALATLAKARKKFPQNYTLELCTALAEGRKKDYQQAIEHYTAAEVIAKATDPSRLDDQFYFQFGATWERLGDFTQAEQYFEKCLKLAPDSAEAQNYLGYMWAEHDTKLEEARQLIEKAVKSEPKNAAYLDSLGWVLFKLHQPKEALGYLLKAVELTEEPDATLYDHLGDIYAALNELPKAREAWTKSLAVEPNDQIRKKLETQPGK